MIARGSLQLEIGAQRESGHADGVRTRISYIPVLVRVGVTPWLEGRVETNTYAWQLDSEATQAIRSRGWSPPSLGAKVHLYDATGGPNRSLGAIVRIAPASGSGPFGTRRLTSDMRLAADFDLSSTFSLNPNIGVGWYDSSAGRFTAALAAATLVYAPSDRVNVFIDAAHQRPASADGASWVIVDGGLAYIIRRNVQLDISLGGGAYGPVNQFFVSVGISLRAGH